MDFSNMHVPGSVAYSNYDFETFRQPSFKLASTEEIWSRIDREMQEKKRKAELRKLARIAKLIEQKSQEITGNNLLAFTPQSFISGRPGELATSVPIQEVRKLLNENSNVIPIFKQAENAVKKLSKAKKVYKKRSHNKNIFRSIKSNGNKRPHCIAEAQRRCGTIARDPMLAIDYPEMGVHYWHQDKGGRKCRSESDEAIVALIIPALLQYFDVIRSEFGFGKGKDFVNLGYQKIIDMTGLSMRQVIRYMKYLKSRDMVDVSVVVKNYGLGNIRHEKTIIRINPRIFEMLDLVDQYQQDLIKANAKLELQKKSFDNKNRLLKLKTLAFETSQNKRAQTKFMKKVNNINKESQSSSVLKPMGGVIQKTPAMDKRYIDLALQLHKKDSSISVTDYLKKIIEKSKDYRH